MRSIYICITPFFPSNDNWRGSYILDQVKAIKRNSNYEVIVFRCCGLGSRKEEYEIDGIKVYYTPALFTPSYFFSGLFNSLNGKLFLRTLRNLGIVLGEIEVVHSHTAGFACFSAAVKKSNPKIKSLIQYHDRDPYQILYGKFADWKINARFRAINFIKQFEFIDVHVCISKVVEDNVKNFPEPGIYENYNPYLERLKLVQGITLPNDINSIVLYNGVNTALFYTGEKSQSQPLSNSSKEDCFRIGCIANFQKLKDHITLIRSFEILVKKGYTNMKLSLLGTGETLVPCKEYIISHNLENFIEWPKEMSHDKLPDYYRSLDLFVLPSTYEGFGCVLTESYACGIPFMTCKHQGAAECVDEKENDLWLFDPHDYQSLAKKIERFYKNREKQHLNCSFDIDELVVDFLKVLHLSTR